MCGGEGVLPILLLRHLGSSPRSIYYLKVELFNDIVILFCVKIFDGAVILKNGKNCFLPNYFHKGVTGQLNLYLVGNT